MISCNIVFYSNLNDLRNFNKNNEKWKFVIVKEFKEQKSIVQKFIENELKSIKIFESVINLILKFKFFRNYYIKINHLNNLHNIQPNFKIKTLSIYLTP